MDRELHTGQPVAGTDEAGRGPLAGDVIAAAVILDPRYPIAGLNDSKRLTQRQRETCYLQITERAQGYAVARASVAEIDELNILQASLLAMWRAVEQLNVTPRLVVVDGNRCPAWPYDSVAVVGGDARVSCVAAASILAKVTRDREMVALDARYPGYGFARHKGYGTREHLAALERLGPCAVHRRSFAPVSRLLAR
ncbi:MAG: ribonuclease [Pseudomonadota bacterium]|jgi:ribonuclease HII